MKSSSRQAIGVVRGAIIAVVASALVLVVGASPSEAATNWMAQAGDFIEDELLEVNSFLPTDITVVEGDTITWDIVGFHTVSLLSGADRPEDIVQLPDGRLALNPEVLFPTGSPEYDGTGIVNSGLPPEEGPAEPFSLTFTEASTYDLVCLVHPHMPRLPWPV